MSIQGFLHDAQRARGRPARRPHQPANWRQWASRANIFAAHHHRPINHYITLSSYFEVVSIVSKYCSILIVSIRQRTADRSNTKNLPSRFFLRIMHRFLFAPWLVWLWCARPWWLVAGGGAKKQESEENNEIDGEETSKSVDSVWIERVIEWEIGSHDNK